MPKAAAAAADRLIDYTETFTRATVLGVMTADAPARRAASFTPRGAPLTYS